MRFLRFMTATSAFARVSLSNLLPIAPSFPTWEEYTKPGAVHNAKSGLDGPFAGVGICA
jgi:hypothetical protein